MSKDNLDDAIAKTAKVKLICEFCGGNGIAHAVKCLECRGYGYTILKLAATDIVRRLPKREGHPVEYENLLEKKDE